MYQDMHIGYCARDNTTAEIFDKRVCSKCGRIQKNKGYFEVSFKPYYWVNRWFTIGYATPTKADTTKPISI